MERECGPILRSQRSPQVTVASIVHFFRNDVDLQSTEFEYKRGKCQSIQEQWSVVKRRSHCSWGDGAFASSKVSWGLGEVIFGGHFRL